MKCFRNKQSIILERIETLMATADIELELIRKPSDIHHLRVLVNNHRATLSAIDRLFTIYAKYGTKQKED